MPNDWRYEKISGVFSAFNQYDPANWTDSIGEIADSLVDIYHTERFAWLSVSNHEDVNEALEMVGSHSVTDGIAWAQHVKISGFADLAIQLIKEQIED